MRRLRINQPKLAEKRLRLKAQERIIAAQRPPEPELHYAPVSINDREHQITLTVGEIKFLTTAATTVKKSGVLCEEDLLDVADSAVGKLRHIVNAAMLEETIEAWAENEANNA